MPRSSEVEAVVPTAIAVRGSLQFAQRLKRVAMETIAATLIKY
ncbi:MAG: hypothetical protein NWT02_01105 [Opitutales bacterium]|jgi:hypothetical protein|nr:hypothetical protein [Opitutales bacterium]MDP4643101.1 hypothetical protein [Opitutales bacterium]MDP4693424.1 hypothetical protein [Opitutales bacterium]MDP4776352.1 hypothetical protein [Opitutales bacterium]MDP4884675.1 hypothetical protein [Opitutales bacterium]